MAPHEQSFLSALILCLDQTNDCIINFECDWGPEAMGVWFPVMCTWKLFGVVPAGLLKVFLVAVIFP